ncbi:MAG: hypothetical protein H6Q90_474 [Deltaproteobacteria bacterium]|nr:hypothetical protein [Deltaproteobacteria bacterium]
MTRKNLLLAFGFATALAAPACVVSGRGSLHATGTTSAVVYQEPPQEQVETVTVRPGFVWIRGRWDWQNGQWAWVGGRWERERVGYTRQHGHWERRGNAWHWVEGRWVGGAAVVDTSNASGGVVVTGGTHPVGHEGHQGHEGHEGPPAGGIVDASNASGGVVVSGGTNPAYPSAAPPPPRAETSGKKAGFVWVSGHWDWKAGQWAWLEGHWERERANKVWTPGRWELQGGRWTWIEGSWTAGGPVVRDHR